jgi:transcription-repair coupling factor (superfamily II helicase)
MWALAGVPPRAPDPDTPLTIRISGEAGSFLSLLASRIDGKILLFYETEEEGLLLKEEIEFFSGSEAHLFPLFEEKVFDRRESADRALFLYHLANDERFVGLFPFAALTHRMAGPDPVKAGSKTISFGDVLFQEDLLRFLEEAGYETVSLVREKGEYAKRGSIVDIFTSSLPEPVRIEFLGDEVLSLRRFSPVSQRSLKEIETFTLTPARMAREEDATIFDYLDETFTVVHRGRPHLIEHTGGEGIVADRATALLDRNVTIDVSGIAEGSDGAHFEVHSNRALRQSFAGKQTEIFPSLASKLRDDWEGFTYVYLLAHHPQQAERLREILGYYGMTLPVLRGISFPQQRKEWGIAVAPVRRGFRAGRTVVITEEDVVGPKKRLARRTWNGRDEFLNSFRDLAEGQYVVHLDHGIGIYRGMTELTVAGHRKDYLLIEYHGGDRLYVPVENLHLVQKYVAGEKHTPKIDSLGSPAWHRTKRKVKGEVADIVNELIRIYAERKIKEGYAFSPEDELYREMASRFEYEETDGQLAAIEDVLKDLKADRPMDRLVCGDVGFGKTEVAMRAAFKVVMDNKQVLILVPTTILAQQHYNNFRERFRDYPIIVEMLSRFRTKKEQDRVVESLKRGGVDIVVGTHRLLQKDLQVRDLGLIIVDEEHRFGVQHKEKLKMLKTNVDVLTLSATPIPRTLHMAFAGIKDLSVISTPPLDRLAVKTTVVRFGDAVIRKAVEHEINRGGQIFFMHNFIHNIAVVYDYLTALLPHIRIAVAHGQMDGRTLEKVMFDFIEGKYEILLSTNIIESGLDIPNVNTIFINNAHRLGLADLYQLRGRVGRSTRQAYAYLLIPKDEVLSRDAALRLKIIEELSELGSGFRVANYDMEIRGAGNLLGKEQSGNVNLVGFELYCTMLDEAVSKLKEADGGQDEALTPEISLPIDAFIPDSYIDDSTQKLMMYKKLARLTDESEIDDVREELADRFGEIPGPLSNLLDVIALKTFLARRSVKRVEYSGGQIVLHVTEQSPLDMKRLLGLAKSHRGAVKLLPDGRIVVRKDDRGPELIGTIRKILMEIAPL